jgi:hypothetical protein
MRYVNGFFCVLLSLFALVQYNDPDALLWFLIYAIPAAFAGLAAFRLVAFARSQRLIGAYGVTLAAAIAGAIYMWPASIADWWDNELVREGLGLIIVVIVLLSVGLTLWQTRRTAGLGRVTA